MKALTVDTIAVAAGLLVLMLALTMSPYRDLQAFQAVQTLDVAKYPSPEAASQVYWRVREEQLTAKFQLQDYGATLLIVGVCLACLRWAYRVSSLRDLIRDLQPIAPWKVWAFGFGAVILQISRDYLVVPLQMYRNEAPPWADSPGVAWMGNGLMALFYSAFTLLVGVIGAYRYSSGPSMASLLSKPSSVSLVWWILLGPIVLAFALWAALLIAAGGFEQLPAALCWLAFSLMWLAGKQSPANNALERERGQ
jgi:hypothetical protein